MSSCLYGKHFTNWAISPTNRFIPLDSSKALCKMFSGIVSHVFCVLLLLFLLGCLLSFYPFFVVVVKMKTPIVCDASQALHWCYWASHSVLSPVTSYGGRCSWRDSFLVPNSLLFPSCQTARIRTDFMWTSLTHPREILVFIWALPQRKADKRQNAFTLGGQNVESSKSLKSILQQSPCQGLERWLWWENEWHISKSTWD